MNLTKEQIMRLKDLYLKKIDEMVQKKDLKKLKLEKRYKKILFIAFALVSIIGALVGGGLVGTIVYKIFTLISYNITLGGCSSLFAVLGIIISNIIFVNRGIHFINNLTGHSKGINECKGISEIYASLKDKTMLNTIGFNEFLEKINMLCEKDIRDKEFINEMAIDLDFFTGQQNRRLISVLSEGKGDQKKHYKLNEEFSRLVYANIKDIKEIFRVLISKAKEYHKYNESMHQKSQEKMFMELPRVFSNVSEYQKIFGNPNSTTMQSMSHQSEGYPSKLPVTEKNDMLKQSQTICSAPPQIISMRYLNPQISENSVLSRKIYFKQNRDNKIDSRNRN